MTRVFTTIVILAAAHVFVVAQPSEPIADVALNERADGYRGVWYMNQPSNNEYVYKYSGGLGTYCAKHQPFAVYSSQAQKTFFCFGGAAKGNDRRLWHMVSYFDHEKKVVPRPVILLDKRTSDAHDNPVISVDAQGYIWIFSTSHGTSRPSYIHRSKRPHDINAFKRIAATRQNGGVAMPILNFSYMQAWHVPSQGFACFFTKYGYPSKRTSCFMSSPDGVTWSSWQRLAAIHEGHYQISAVGQDRIGTVMNYHPRGKGLNWRTNLYYMESADLGRTWKAANGQIIEVPLQDPDNAALVTDYESPRLNVYLKDISFDRNDRPIVLFLTSKGYEAGPKNSPRTWRTARWTGDQWEVRPAMNSDNNYDMGSLWIDEDGAWRVIAPTEAGPQPFNPGGEVAIWQSRDQGRTWQKLRALTKNSPHNHTYVRRPVNAHSDFFALWADGHGRQPSASRLYYCDREGNVFELPRRMTTPTVTPQRIAADN